MQRFRHSLRAFLRDESGVLLAEALILLPMLIWGFLALIVYWDVFRTINIAQKAAYSIADTLSRQTVVTQAFVDDLDNVLTFLTPGTPSSEMRITSFQLDEGSTNLPGFDGDDNYCMLFSRVVGATSGSPRVPHDEASLEALTSQIPDLANLESVVLVETWVDYVPDFDTGVLNFTPGVTNQTFTQFIVTRPRNDRRVVLAGQAHSCT
jgi:hypothetical protein